MDNYNLCNNAPILLINNRVFLRYFKQGGLFIFVVINHLKKVTMKEKILLQCERIYEVQNLIKWMLTASFYDGSPLNQKAYFKSCLEQRLKDLINEVVILDDAINKY